MFLLGELSVAQGTESRFTWTLHTCVFLGAAFVAVDLVSAAFYALRRKHDCLLIYFALFYGIRLWVQASLLGVTVIGSVPHSAAFGD